MAQKKSAAPSPATTAPRKAAPSQVDAIFFLAGAGSTAISLVAPPKDPILVTLRRGDSAIRVALGERVRLVPGTYRAECAFFPNEEAQIQCGKVYSQPSFSINAEVAVKDGGAEYPLPATIDCFALVLDPEVSRSLRVRGFDGRMRELPTFAKEAGRRVAFIRGRWNFPHLTIESIDQDGSVREFSLCTEKDYATGDAILVENGEAYGITDKGFTGLGHLVK